MEVDFALIHALCQQAHQAELAPIEDGLAQLACNTGYTARMSAIGVFKLGLVLQEQASDQGHALIGVRAGTRRFRQGQDTLVGLWQVHLDGDWQDDTVLEGEVADTMKQLRTLIGEREGKQKVHLSLIKQSALGMACVRHARRGVKSSWNTLDLNPAFIQARVEKLVGGAIWAQHQAAQMELATPRVGEGRGRAGPRL